jgi:phosphoribosylformylglycinamidine cyclo-ligase
MDSLTYRQSGVDIGAGEEAVRRIARLARSTFRPEVLGEIGSFAGFSRIPDRYRDPVIVSSADGVGSKLKVAFLADRHDTVGIDLVAMGVNDLLVHGAEPLFFLDYLAAAKVVPEKVEAIITGVVAGCKEAGCALIGGETAELPDFYAAGEYDLAGFAVGVVERSRIVNGASVRPGDVILGLASSGLHSNGFSLARKIIFGVMGLTVHDPLPGINRTVGEDLLLPTRIYVRSILPLLAEVSVRGMAHVTGGGITGNLPRVLPEACRAVIRRGSWVVPSIFLLLMREGNVAEAEMLRTFNMGIGFILIVGPADVEAVNRRLLALGEQVFQIGEIVSGERGVEYVQV